MNKKLASQFAVATAIAMLFGTSAFAETRHRDETNRSGQTHERHQRDGNHDRSQQQQQQAQPQAATVQPERSRGTNEYRNYDRSQTQTRTYNNNNNYNRNNNNNRWNDSNRNNNNNRYNSNNNRNYSNNNQWRGNDHRGSSRDYGRSGSAYHARGRISRIDRWNGGYRVYVGGALYPFFIPEARFRVGNWRVGVDIGLGGYYNPLGYYDYYDDGYYSGGYVGAAPVYSSGELRGVVETVDYRRGTFVLRDDASNSFVTVLMRGRFESIRPGDYISVAGDWSRNGIFEAYRADLIDNGYRQQ
jgi:hypothetical protein